MQILGDFAIDGQVLRNLYLGSRDDRQWASDDVSCGE